MRDASCKLSIDSSPRRVQSYAGIRTVGKARDKAGHLRFTLNGKEIFHFGPLDQGWWPDGLLTPPSDDALLADIACCFQCGRPASGRSVSVGMTT